MKRRHHTVSRCYLQNFSNKEGLVWVLDIKDKIFQVKPENILVEKDFYTITLKNGEKSLVVEDTLSNIESNYSSIFKNKISQGQLLTDDERAKVSIFIAALYLRTKSQREGIREMFQKLKKDMEDWKKQFEMMTPEALRCAAAIPSGDGKKISLDDIDQYLNSSEEQHSVSVISNLPETAQIIFNMKWAFLKNYSTGFVTSDDPVVLLRPESIKKYGSGAIGSLPGLIYKDVELTLPLSNDLLLLAGWKLEKNSFLPADDKMAKIFNHRTITHSSERIIASSKEKAREIKIKYTETALNQPKK